MAGEPGGDGLSEVAVSDYTEGVSLPTSTSDLSSP